MKEISDVAETSPEIGIREGRDHNLVSKIKQDMSRTKPAGEISEFNVAPDSHAIPPTTMFFMLIAKLAHYAMAMLFSDTNRRQ
jgi:hypothetical protein